MVKLDTTVAGSVDPHFHRITLEAVGRDESLSTENAPERTGKVIALSKPITCLAGEAVFRGFLWSV